MNQTRALPCIAFSYHRPIRLLFVVIVVAESSIALAQQPSSEDAVAIETAAESLGESGNEFPWYDSETDSVQRVNLKKTSPPTMRSSPGDWSLLANILFWTMIVLLAALLAWLLYLAARWYLDQDDSAVDTSHEPVADTPSLIDRVEALPFEVRRPTDDLLSEAKRHYQAGNFSEAIIYLYSHQLLQLDRAQCIHLTKGKTNRQYLREAHRRSTVADLLERTMVCFEDVFFGGHAMGRSEFESCWQHVGRFDNLVLRADG